MSHTKHLADLLKVCSILPALVIMPAMAESLSERQVITQDKTYKNLTVDGVSSSVANNGGVFYLEDVQDVLLTFKGESKFVNNSILNGGMGAVIGNGWLSTKDADKWNPYTPGGHILFDGDTLFMNNTTNNANGAGAIFNYGIGTVDNPDILFNGEAEFIGNSSTGVSNSFCVGGGAIYHRDGMIVFNDDANFVANSSPFSNPTFFTMFIRSLIASIPTAKDTTIPIINGRSIMLKVKSFKESIAAPSIAGAPSKNENLAADSLSNFIALATVIVVPDLEKPGITAAA